jgi:hypothetical protein
VRAPVFQYEYRIRPRRTAIGSPAKRAAKVPPAFRQRPRDGYQ